MARGPTSSVSAPAASGEPAAPAESGGEPILIGTISPNTGNLAAYGTAVTTGCTSAIAAAYAKQAGYDKVGMVYCAADTYSKGLYDSFSAASADPVEVRDALAADGVVYDRITGTYSLDETGTPVKGASVITFEAGTGADGKPAVVSKPLDLVTELPEA